MPLRKITDLYSIYPNFGVVEATELKMHGVEVIFNDVISILNFIQIY
jgi:hypothetical protein